MSRKNFGEFMGFFLKGLDPFKIQTKFNFVWLPEFLIQILLGIWTSPKKKLLLLKLSSTLTSLMKFR
jgi:hypothetical protein